MIELSNVNVTFHANSALEKKALVGVSLIIPKYQFITVIGSNGAGKSTLLNLLSGEISSFSGSLTIHNNEMKTLSLSQRARLISRVHQDPFIGTCADLTIEENLALAYMRGKNRGWKSSLSLSRRKFFKQRLVILELGLEKRLSERVSSLSGGERQALSLIMATLLPSELLLLDEHTAALDPRMAAFMMNLTSKVVKELNLTVLMITHSMRYALDYGDRIIMMNQGEMIFDYNVEEKQQLTMADLINKFELLTV